MSAAEIMKELRRIEKQVYRDLRKALKEEGEDILYVSQHEYVPIAEGDLFNSGKVTVIEDGTIDGLEVVISYGDEKTAPYALATHETPSGHDPPTWKGKAVQFETGGPKYLERPLFEAENGMIDRIGAKVKLK